MTGLTTDMLSHACRIFARLAYPAGEESIPPARQQYLNLPPGKEIADCHNENPFPPGSFQVMTDASGRHCGYAIRLGSSHFPHLKLRVQWLNDESQGGWVFMVDTHDAFSSEHIRPPADHPDAVKWTQLQQANTKLKEAVERAWEEAGLLTFNAVLRLDLQRPAPNSP